MECRRIKVDLRERGGGVFGVGMICVCLHLHTLNKMTFNIRITFKGGYSFNKIEAKNFGEACLKLYKEHAKRFVYITMFELI